MFDCKVCAEKDDRIASLERHIDLLSRLLFPNPVAPTGHLPLIDLEAPLSEGTPAEELGCTPIREADRLLSGNYEHNEQ